MLITITGPSGSGKSYICDMLCKLDNRIVHLNIDLVGHKVLDLESVKEQIYYYFNITPNCQNKIDRKILGDLVFNNQEKMQMLSAITWHEMERQIDEFIEMNKHKIVILDWILIPKTKYFKESDLNILVKMDFSSRMARAISRDNITSEQFKTREKATLDFDKNEFDYIINNEEEEKTKGLVKQIYDKSIISR